ncbi:MAG: IMP dehydrogenase, partial [Patescibacteria group bacterium]
MEDKEIRKRVVKYIRKKIAGLPNPEMAITFADVVIIDRSSRVGSRSDIRKDSKGLVTELTKSIRLNIPIVSANMADVTESAMAISLARKGGLGFIHQFMSIEKRIAQVKKVKRADNEVIESPYRIKPSATLKDALDFMAKCKTSGLLVVDDSDVIVGILTSRDVDFKKYQPEERLRKILVTEVMTKKVITAPANISVKEAITILEEHKIEKLPLVNEENKPVGLITAKDVVKKYQFPFAVRDRRGRLLVGASVGLAVKFLEEVSALTEAGADVILLDTARANAFRVAEAVAAIKKNFRNIQLIAGNVDNPEGARLLIDAGVDAVKVGIGPGSACKTRVETGVGCPQLSAV